MASATATAWAAMGIPRLSGMMLWVYLAFRGLDIAYRGVVKELVLHPWLGFSFVAEVGGGALLPAFLYAGIPRAGFPRGAVAASLLVVGGIVLNRLNVCWLGLLPYTGRVYLPSWMEVVSTLALALALVGVLSFIAISRFLPVFDEAREG